MVDEQALGEQATGLIRSIVSLDAVLLATAVVGGPRLRVVGSSALESAELWAWLRDAALRGTGQILDPAAGANVVLVDDALELRQGLAGLRVDTRVGCGSSRCCGPRAARQGGWSSTERTCAIGCTLPCA